MILLDTNVVSELMKVTCDPRVVQWLDAQRDSDLVTSAVTVAEIRLGIELLPDGKRKSSLAQRAEVALGSLAASTVSFDGLAAREFATIAAARRKLGRPIGYPVLGCLGARVLGCSGARRSANERWPDSESGEQDPCVIMKMVGDNMMMRTQITLDKREYELVKREATALGVSVAEFVRRAIRLGLPPSGQKAPWMRYAGLVESGNPRSSQTVDEVVYGSKD